MLRGGTHGQQILAGTSGLGSGDIVRCGLCILERSEWVIVASDHMSSGKPDCFKRSDVIRAFCVVIIAKDCLDD